MEVNLQKNQIHTLTVDGWAAGGAGVARLGGRVVFVSGAVRGETVRALILKVGKRVAYAKAVEILAPSGARVAPDCPYFPRCGGCAWRHISYAEELSLKRQRVQDALARIGGSDVKVEEILGADDTLRYRNKVIYPVSPSGAVGFYRARTHDVVDAAECLLVPAAADAAAEALRAWMARCGVPGYDERTQTGLVRHLFLRQNRKGKMLACIVANGSALPHEAELVAALRAAAPGLVGVLLNTNTVQTNVVLGGTYRTLWGEDRLTDTLCGLDFRLSVPSFFQVNRCQCEKLYSKAAEFAALTGRETLLDLYCGVGTITLTMAKYAARVIGAELVPEAIADARENARRNGVENAEFFCGDAGAVAAKLASEGLRPDVITVDPPRKGLAADVVETIAGMAPERVVYVSCDPATLARDLQRFAALGYAARRACAVDMFPRADHVETVCLLARGG